jgi:hypothetical protein
MRREHLCFGSRTEMSFQMPSARISSIGRAISGFFAELKRRRVLKIAGAYIAGAWLAAEIISFLLEQVMAPAWSFRLLAAYRRASQNHSHRGRSGAFCHGRAFLADHPQAGRAAALPAHTGFDRHPAAGRFRQHAQ